MSTALAASILSTTLSRQGSFSDAFADEDEPDVRSGQSSVAFICTVCSAMMGSTLMTLPWAFQSAGLVASLIMITLVGGVSYYTCYIILGWGAPPNGHFADFSGLCCHYLGNWSRHVANGTSVCVCIGVCTVYHCLMAQCLQGIVLSIGEFTKSDVWRFLCCGSGSFEYVATSIFVGVCVLPLTCFRTIDRLMTIGSFGGISVVYNAAFIVGNALVDWPDAAQRSNHRVQEGGSLKEFGVFIGTLGLSLFVHSMLLQMGNAHRYSVVRPSVVKRDVAIAYVIAVMFYIVVGAVPAVAFELRGHQLSQNILLVYSLSSWGAMVGKVALTLQIMVVYPLLATVIRGQFYSSVLGTAWPGWPPTIAFSVALVAFTTLVSSVYPHVGNIVGYVGVYTAIVYMLGLPILVHVKACKAANRASVLSTVVHGTIFLVASFAFLMQFIF